MRTIVVKTWHKYPTVIIADKITHIQKPTEHEPTEIHLVGGYRIDTNESISSVQEKVIEAFMDFRK